LIDLGARNGFVASAVVARQATGNAAGGFQTLIEGSPASLAASIVKKY
jgi:hypothetical protein